MKKTVTDNITAQFKQFVKARHAEDKGRHYNLLQEIYSKAELFDLSLVEDSTKIYPKDFMLHHHFEGSHNEELVIESEYLKKLTLPFEAVFCKLPDTEGSVHAFMREYAPNIITGIILCKNERYELNSPFKIDLEKATMHLSMYGIYKYANVLRSMGFKEDKVEQYVKIIISMTIANSFCPLYWLSNLPKYAVAEDKPTKHEYFPRKGLTTIKTIKPIYYVLDKKEEKEHNKYNRIKPVGSITFSHAFKVRAHWRTIDKKTYGKNRAGVYNVLGYTWVKEHIKGEGELVKKMRVLK